MRGNDPVSAFKFDVFGRRVAIVRANGQWLAFYLGNEGKRRRAEDIVLPATLAESELRSYLDDLCHEWATYRHPGVRIIDA